MDNCIFCKIVRGKIPSEKVFEDDVSIAFLDINPVNDGHTLIIPKEHFAQMTETPDELVGKLYVNAKKLIPAVKQGTNADFVALTVIGTDVPHFHIHLIPRHSKDGLAGFWPTKKYDRTEHMKEVGEKIRKAI